MEIGALLSTLQYNFYLSSYATDTVKVIKGYGRRELVLVDIFIKIQ